MLRIFSWTSTILLNLANFIQLNVGTVISNILYSQMTACTIVYSAPARNQHNKLTGVCYGGSWV